MTHALAAVAVLGLICVAAMVLPYRLFWRQSPQDVGEAGNWAQRNDLRTPSLEQPPEAQDNAVDAAVASQILGPE